MDFISIFYLLDIIVLTILFCRHVWPKLLQSVTQTIISIDNYCNTEFKKLERNKKLRKHLKNYGQFGQFGQFGQHLRVILREMRISILNDQSKFCKH